MSTATAVDHFADAIRGALAIRPAHTAPALTKTPGRTAQPVIPTHNPRTSHPATSTTLALAGQGSR